MRTKVIVLPALPAPLRTWIQERHFDVCPWEAAPAETAKIVGRDAWGFGRVVLFRLPIGTNALRYYATICQGPGIGQAVGYWLEVRGAEVSSTGEHSAIGTDR